MSTKFKNQMKEVMTTAWQMFRITGESFSECLKRSWLLLKLKAQMKKRTVQFFYQKVNGEIRQAFGTTREEVIAHKVTGNDTRKKNDNLVTYWDTEKESFRSFKKFNLIKIL